MPDNATSSTPVTIAQAWSAPIVMCVIGAACAIWGSRVRPEASDVTAALILMIVAPVTATALIARGIVGLYQSHRWQGCVAIVGGVLLFAGVVVGMNAIPWRGDSAAHW
ncbi:MAG: hypothetical protein KDI32_06380 [Pseudomonadales bacterium]|jgi:peptidoglycan/LPS O-acetylase OafA/YrhL|nr:hypothetical protein [Pseudomonadales bacterium]